MDNCPHGSSQSFHLGVVLWVRSTELFKRAMEILANIIGLSDDLSLVTAGERGYCKILFYIFVFFNTNVCSESAINVQIIFLVCSYDFSRFRRVGRA